MRKAKVRFQVRLDDNNYRQLQAIIRALNRNPALKFTLPTLVNFMLDSYGIPRFLESETFKFAAK